MYHAPNWRNIPERDRDEKSDSSGRVSWLGLFAFRETWAYVLTKFLTDPISWFWLTWLPDFFKKTRGLDIKNSWVHLVAIYTISMLLSILRHGWFTGHLIQRGWTATKARKTGLVIFALCVMPVVLALKANEWVAVCLIGLALASHHAWATNLYAVVSDTFPKRAVAAIAGIGGMAGSVGAESFCRLLPDGCWIITKNRPGGETGGVCHPVRNLQQRVCRGLCDQLTCSSPRFEQVDMDRSHPGGSPGPAC